MKERRGGAGGEGAGGLQRPQSAGGGGLHGPGLRIFLLFCCFSSFNSTVEYFFLLLSSDVSSIKTPLHSDLLLLVFSFTPVLFLSLPHSFSRLSI